MSLPVNIHKALVVEKELPLNYEKRMKQFARDFGLGVRVGLCAREIALNHWRRQQEQGGEYQESISFLMYGGPDNPLGANRDSMLKAVPDGFMVRFNEKWKQDSFKHDDDLIADLCLRGLFCESRGGARVGAGTYALTDKGLRLSAPAMKKIAYHIAGDELSPSSWIRVFAFFIVSEFVVVPLLAPIVIPVLDRIDSFIRTLGQ
ncbi:MAG: hypothetical protein J4G17_00100 [Anaerolineae bacterium]|nr:hypothetical protein [Anaerolineae bacterium]